EGSDAYLTSSNTKTSASGPKKTVSPTPIVFTIASALLAMPRGSRLYGWPVVGSSTSHTRTSVVSAKNGSILAEFGSGIRHMSDSWIAFQPAIEEPSNIMPSANVSSSIMLMSKVTCCHLPRGSVNRKSAYLTSLSLITFRTSLAVVMSHSLSGATGVIGRRSDLRSNGVHAGLPRTDPDGFFDVGDEYLAVADPARLGSPADRLDGFLDHLIGEHNLDFHLGEKIDHVLGAAIEFGMAFLPPEAF